VKADGIMGEWLSCSYWHMPTKNLLLLLVLVPSAPPFLGSQGLGKTVQVIALICHLIEASATKGASTSSGTTSSSSGPGRYLICCPASVLPNWAAEVKRWAPQLKVVVYKGSAEAREDIYYDQVG
jgi:hypothetical protein